MIFLANCPVNFPFAYSNGTSCCENENENCENSESFDCPDAPCSDYNDGELLNKF